MTALAALWVPGGTTGTVPLVVAILAVVVGTSTGRTKGRH